MQFPIFLGKFFQKSTCFIVQIIYILWQRAIMEHICRSRQRDSKKALTEFWDQPNWSLTGCRTSVTSIWTLDHTISQRLLFDSFKYVSEIKVRIVIFGSLFRPNNQNKGFRVKMFTKIEYYYAFCYRNVWPTEYLEIKKDTK